MFLLSDRSDVRYSIFEPLFTILSQWLAGGQCGYAASYEI